MRLSTLLRFAATGSRQDAVRIVTTAVGAAAGTVALLCAMTVAVTGPDDGPYRNHLLAEQGPHPGVVVALVLLGIPLLTFVGQCSRIGAPARDRRLASLAWRAPGPATCGVSRPPSPGSPPASGRSPGSSSTSWAAGSWSRRMIALPLSASRTSSAILLSVLVGAFVEGMRVNVLLGHNTSLKFYADTFDLIGVAIAVAVVIAAAGLFVNAAEGIVGRRRTNAALVATGTPLPVLARAAPAETLLPLLPGVVLAAATGVLAARGVLGTRVQHVDAAGLHGHMVSLPAAVDAARRAGRRLDRRHVHHHRGGAAVPARGHRPGRGCAPRPDQDPTDSLVRAGTSPHSCSRR
jgi:hypothetical protein